jgi:hypothetical protein
MFFSFVPPLRLQNMIKITFDQHQAGHLDQPLADPTHYSIRPPPFSDYSFSTYPPFLLPFMAFYSAEQKDPQ